MSVTAEKKAEIIADNARAKGDTGSPDVQVALLTAKNAGARSSRALRTSSVVDND